MSAAADNTLPPHLARCVRSPQPIDEDELPPWLGARLTDTTHDIHRAATEAAQDEEHHD